MTVEEFRNYIWDRSPDDNELLQGIEFTDEEIVKAMGHAARAYRTVPPMILQAIDPLRLPTDTNIFFDATGEALYRMKMHSLARNHFTYDAGNVKVDDVGVKIQMLDKLSKEMGETWRMEARMVKSQRNVSGFYGSIN
jgi:hypothetical protein